MTITCEFSGALFPDKPLSEMTSRVLRHMSPVFPCVKTLQAGFMKIFARCLENQGPHNPWLVVLEHVLFSPIIGMMIQSD